MPPSLCHSLWALVTYHRASITSLTFHLAFALQWPSNRSLLVKVSATDATVCRSPPHGQQSRARPAGSPRVTPVPDAQVYTSTIIAPMPHYIVKARYDFVLNAADKAIGRHLPFLEPHLSGLLCRCFNTPRNCLRPFGYKREGPRTGLLLVFFKHCLKPLLRGVSIFKFHVFPLIYNIKVRL